MNLAELNFLKRQDLSHAARSLYILCLRPKAEQGEIYLSAQEISAFLSVSSPVQSTPGDPAFCRQILEELAAHHLLSFQEPQLAPFGKASLPMFEQSVNILPALPFRMHGEWRPGPSFITAARLSGLPDGSFTEEELSGFISYWQEKPEKRNQSAWERAFCQRLLRKRSARKGSGKATVRKSAAAPAPKAQESRYQAQKPRFSL